MNKEEGTIICLCKNSARLGGKKGVNIPGVKLGMPVLSEKDKRDIAWGAERGVHIVFASFVSSAEDVQVMLQ